MTVCDEWSCQKLLHDRQMEERCKTLHAETWSDPSKEFYHDCPVCNPPPNVGGRPAKSITRPVPPAEREYKGDPDGYDLAKRTFFAACMQAEGGCEEYSEAAFRRAFKRAKRDPDDNRKRKERDSYSLHRAC